MNIKQALKEKNKLAKKVTDLMERTNKYNSMDEGGIRSYDPQTSLSAARSAFEELVELKTKIHMANSKVYGKIFLMSECKSYVKYLKSLNCTEGTIVKQSYGDTSVRQLTTVNAGADRRVCSSQAAFNLNGQVNGVKSTGQWTTT
jgi:hypothetical protein